MTPSEPPDLDRLVVQARTGGAADWGTVVRACYPRVVRAVERKLTWPMQYFYNPAEIVTDVFCRVLSDPNWPDFLSFGALIKHLETQAELLAAAELRRLR